MHYFACSFKFQIIFYQLRVGCLLVPKFYHERASTNVLKHLTYLGEVKPENSNSEFKHPGIGRKYHAYKKTDFSIHTILATYIDWLFPDKYIKSKGLSMGRFQFLLPNLSNLVKTFFQPSANLINTETGTEEISTVLTQYSFYPEQEAIKENIEKYKNLPISYFINESYFLFDKSDLIKQTIITALNEKNSI